MFPFNNSAKKKISPANINLNLGVSPPRNKKPKSISPKNLLHHNESLKKAYSISISPPKSRKTPNKPFTSHDLRQSINDYYTQKTYNKPTKLNLINKLGTFTNNLKKTLFTKNKPVSLNLGVSPPHNNIGFSIGGKISTKKSTKNSTKK